MRGRMLANLSLVAYLTEGGVGGMGGETLWKARTTAALVQASDGGQRHSLGRNSSSHREKS